MVLYWEELSVPAGTLESSPATQEIVLMGDFLVDVGVIIPSGHAGLANLKIRDGTSQVIPFNVERSIRGDGNEILSKLMYRMSHPYKFVLEGWNDDVVNDHAFLVYFNILTVDQLSGRQVDLETVKYKEELDRNVSVDKNWFESMIDWFRGDL